MEQIFQIMSKAVSLGATDIHLTQGQVPVYRVSRKLFFDESKFPLSDEALVNILEGFFGEIEGLEAKFEQKKQVDFSYTYQKTRYRINASLSKGVPVFSLRVIPNGEINLDTMGLSDVVKKMKKIKTGLILVTGKVNSGKSTTMNAFIQEINNEVSRKIVTLEDPIEYDPTNISEEIKNSQNSELKYICSLKLLYTVIYYRCNILLYRALLYI